MKNLKRKTNDEDRVSINLEELLKQTWELEEIWLDYLTEFNKTQLLDVTFDCDKDTLLE